MHGSKPFRLSVSTDLDECSSYPPPCDEVSEFCSNNQGSYACKCQSGFTRVEGKCVSWQEADEIRSKLSEKRSKKKKKKSGSATENEDIHDDDFGGGKKVVYPWYQLLLPLSLFYYAYHYAQPNSFTSIGLVFGLVAMAIIAHKKAGLLNDD